MMSTSRQLFPSFSDINFFFPLMEIPLLLVRHSFDDEEQEKEENQSHVHRIDDRVSQESM